MRRLAYSIAAAATALNLAFAGTSWGSSADEQTQPTLTNLTCSDLAAQSESERSYALIFYLGYVTGRERQSSIDETAAAAADDMADYLLRVRDYCNANPDVTVIDAFEAAKEA